MRHCLYALGLAALSLPAIAANDLPLGRTISGQLVAGDRPSDAGGRSHDYRLALQEGQLVAIHAKSAEVDTFVVVFLPGGDKLGENDDREGGGTDSLLVVSAPQTGVYTVRVNSLPVGDSHLGAYTLRASVIDDD